MAAYQTILELGAGAQAGSYVTMGGLNGCPRGARVGWLDGQDLFLDIDSAYRAAQAMVTDGDGLSVGVSALIKRFHETGWLQSIDQRRRKLKIRRMIDGRRLEVLHLPADALERSIVEKPAQSAHRPARRMTIMSRVSRA